MQTWHKAGSLPAIVLIAVAAILCAPGRATAEMMVVVGNVEVTPGQSSFFDVSLQVTGETYSLAAYQIELNLSGPGNGVRFTGFAEADHAVFPGQVAIQTEERPMLPGSTAAGNDILLVGENPIADGAGVVRILFETDPDSLGVYEVTVDANIERTNYSDGLGRLIPIDRFITGTITVVPEPSSLCLLCGVGLLGMVFFTVQRRAHARTQRVQTCGTERQGPEQ